MRWSEGGDSSDVEDRRGQSFGGGRLGLVGLIVVGGLSLLFRQNLFALFDNAPPAQTQGPVRSSPEEDREVQFVTFVLNDVQKTWAEQLQGYRHAKLVLFRGETNSGCGEAQSAVGPFYCPTDEKVYLDLGFFDELRRRFAAPGEFAQAYVIAHELGHHVQKLEGITRRIDPRDNAQSVRLELQADCFAGVWAHSTAQRKLLEQGDVESALGAAAAVGDDRLQRQATGHVHPETFTHGSSRQRTEWFSRGMSSGNPRDCDTFR